MIILEKIIKELKELNYTDKQINELIKNPKELKETIENELGYFIKEIY